MVFDGQKGGKDIDFFDYSNIKGRSGRLMEHYVGSIYNFAPIPQREKIVIDIPFYEQDKKLLSDEILINIERGEVQQQVEDRYNKLYEIEPELIKIIRKNGTNVNGQRISTTLCSEILIRLSILTLHGRRCQTGISFFTSLS